MVVRLGVRVSSQVREGDGEGRAEEKRNGPSHAVIGSHWWALDQCTGATRARISRQIPVSGWSTSVQKPKRQEHLSEHCLARWRVPRQVFGAAGARAMFNRAEAQD